MAKFPTYEEMAKKVAEEALDGYVYKDKTLREWIDILAQTQWIPVSERLPEDNASYLVTVKQGYIMIGIWCGNPEYWENVIAWHPLPEPYGAESEDEE